VVDEGKAVNRSSRVLLIDDNPLQLKVREAVLRNAGFHVNVATDAEGALSVLRNLADGIGVVVTDHLMPDCSGAELVRLLRAEYKQLPIVVLSGMPEAFGEYAGLDVIFRAKPFPPNELIELVRPYVGQSAPQRGAA
jgi:DNA-binding response OmpR family regulator